MIIRNAAWEVGAAINRQTWKKEIAPGSNLIKVSTRKNAQNIKTQVSRTFVLGAAFLELFSTALMQNSDCDRC